MAKYVIQRGDTLYNISQKTGVSVEKLRDYNNLRDNSIIFPGQEIKIPNIEDSNAFNISGLTIESSHQTKSNHNAAKATKNSKVRATAKDMELLKSRNASSEKNDPNAAAQFVDGAEVEVDPALEDGSYEHPDTIHIVDTTNGHRIEYWYRRLTPELMDGKHFAKAGKNLPINKEQFKEGETYYILLMAINKDTDERIDNMDHLEIYKLDYSYDEASDTSTYNLIQEEGMQGSGQSSIDYSKR